MTNPAIGNVGFRQDLNVRQGATLGPIRVTATDRTTGLPLNLTGSTIRGQIRKTPAAPTFVAAFAITVTDPVAGVFEIDLSEQTTAAIPAGADMTRPESCYVYDIEMVDSLGRVIPLMWGDVRVLREVTRG